jgi:putative pyruvate formate lyase activating enzyme
MFEELRNCILCPRECRADRMGGKSGYCKSDGGYNIASICLHMGEEPVIRGKNGICNVFFVHCNIQCVYCQNYQISRNDKCISENKMNLEKVISEICTVLDTGTDLLGFVSPSHCIPQMKSIIQELHIRGRKPVVVFNSNAYDKVEILRSLENIVDVYLPDFKYSDSLLAMELSDASDYSKIALSAIKEMVRQKGTSLRVGTNGQAEAGVIIRHLVIPGHVENSINALKILSEEISPLLHISLMSQYYPVPEVKGIRNMNRTITSDEYQKVLDALELYGFHRGWVQELDSNRNYRPDFFSEHPFEK